MADSVDVVYLLHFEQPYKHARHYVGTSRADRLAERLHEHRTGAGARLVAVAQAAGIDFRLVRVWAGARARERQIKQNGATRRCPACRPDEAPAFRYCHRSALDVLLMAQLDEGGTWHELTVPRGLAIAVQ